MTKQCAWRNAYHPRKTITKVSGKEKPQPWKLSKMFPWNNDLGLWKNLEISNIASLMFELQHFEHVMSLFPYPYFDFEKKCLLQFLRILVQMGHNIDKRSFLQWLCLLKVLTHYAQNCKDFSKKSLWKSFPIYKTVQKNVAVVKRSCSVFWK